MREMTSPRLLEFLYTIAFTLMSTSCVSSQDYITNVTVVDVGMDVFTLEWEWVIDEADDFDRWGCRIITRINDNSLRVVNEVLIEGVDESYTVEDNITTWELYRSCITPILTNESVIMDGEGPVCTDLIQTEYDPWTQKAEIAVIISGGLIFLLLVAQAINIKWPRDQKRTFTLDDELDEDDDDEGDGKTEPKEDIDNLGFEQDDDATSSVNDWNAAAAVAVVEGKGGRIRTGGLKQWVKHAEARHQSTRLFTDTKDIEDVNHNSSHVQPNSQPIGDVVFEGNAVGHVDEGVAAVEADNSHLRYQSVHQNQEPYRPTNQNQQEFPDDYDQGNQDVPIQDVAYRNHGYEDDLNNQYGYYRNSQQYPAGSGFETQSTYDANIPQLENEYLQYS